MSTSRALDRELAMAGDPDAMVRAGVWPGMSAKAKRGAQRCVKSADLKHLKWGLNQLRRNAILRQDKFDEGFITTMIADVTAMLENAP